MDDASSHVDLPFPREEDEYPVDGGVFASVVDEEEEDLLVSTLDHDAHVEEKNDDCCEKKG